MQQKHLDVGKPCLWHNQVQPTSQYLHDYTSIL